MDAINERFAAFAMNLVDPSFVAAHGGNRDGTIPYVNNGSSLTGMDCQGLIEWCLRQIGKPHNYRGSNDMWRHALSWKGTPEECKAKFGKIPVGAWLFIVKDDGGEKVRGYNDNEGNASHVGVYTGHGLGAVHASSSRGCVAESKFAGKTIKNGGWNRVGMPEAFNDAPVEEADEQMMFMKVTTPNGGYVNMRVKPDKKADRVTKINAGEIVTATPHNSIWSFVEYDGKTGYVMSEYLEEVETMNPAEDPEPDIVSADEEILGQKVILELDRPVAAALLKALQAAI